MRLGLTGGIGSGKSTVAAMLVARGALLVDTDAIARQLTGPGGAAMPALLREFGQGLITAEGALARDAMRQLAFTDSSARKRLEAILHPLIGSEAQRQAGMAAVGQAVVYDVPLLAESASRAVAAGPGAASAHTGGWRSRVDKVLVIDCLEETQVRRVAARPGWDEAMARRVLAQQAPRALRRSFADAIVCNDGENLQALADEVTQLGTWWGLWNNPRSG